MFRVGYFSPHVRSLRNYAAPLAWDVSSMVKSHPTVGAAFFGIKRSWTVELLWWGTIVWYDHFTSVFFLGLEDRNVDRVVRTKILEVKFRVRYWAPHVRSPGAFAAHPYRGMTRKTTKESSHGRACTFWAKMFWQAELLKWGTTDWHDTFYECTRYCFRTSAYTCWLGCANETL